MEILVKILISAVLVAIISELAKREGWVGAMLGTLPIISLLAIVWLYVETRDTQKIAAFSTDIFWLVLPSLSFFIALPWLLRMRLNFWLSLAIALVVMFACYLLMIALLKKIGP